MSLFRPDADAPPAPAAVIGAACRFPGADDVDAFWRLIAEAGIVSAEPDETRQALWAAKRDPVTGPRITTLAGGYLDDIAGFDPGYFAVSPREASKLDPQQRLLLEVTHHALEDAGITRDALRGRRVGVFVGAGAADYMMLGATDRRGIDAYHGIGNSHAVLANRLSYYYNLKGPSLTVDTACSSSLTALHMALQAMVQDELELVILGGVSILASPDLTLAFSQAGMLSPSGRCRTFGAGADGYARAEGVGVVILARPDAPEAAGRIRCLIRGSAVNQDGRSNGITAPNGLAQMQVIRQAMARAGAAPADMVYMEAHGTGTTLGDAIEYNALAGVFRGEPGRTGRPVHVGSAKANIGHMEAAAGMGGLIKVMLMLEHGIIPPHPVAPPHNDVVARAEGVLALAGQAMPIDRPDACIGVSSFGFGGSNAHVVLQAAPAVPVSLPPEGPALLMLSSHDPALLDRDMRRLAAAIETGTTPLPAIARSLVLDREPLGYRVALVAEDRAEAVRRLREAPAIVEAARAPRIAFVFTGQGSQYAGMGADLHARNPVYRDAFDTCAGLVHDIAGITAHELIHGVPEGAGPDAAAAGAERLLDDTHLAQLALFCHERALAELAMAAGLQPVGLIGHSLGELTAQAVAGILAPDDAVRLVHERAAAMQATAPSGAMLAVHEDAGRLRARLAEGSAPGVHLAAVNGMRAPVVAGPVEAVDAFAAALAAEGVTTRRLRTRHAFHTPAFARAADHLRAATAGITPRAATLPVISNLDGRILPPLAQGTDYWSRQMLSTVAFAAGIRTLVDELEVGLFLELGPDRVLAPLILRDHTGRGVHAISMQRRGGDGQRDALNAFGRLFEQGVRIAPDALLPPASPVRLPSRSLARRPFWGIDPQPETATARAATMPVASATSATPAAPPAPGLGGVVARQIRVMQAQLAALAAGDIRPARPGHDQTRGEGRHG
ncbi:type I polyketide synthase [Tistrella mobilis]